MVRTQVQLTEEQARRLRELAAKRHVSMATLIRNGVDRFLKESTTIDHEEQLKRALAVAGRYHSGFSDTSARHDEVLAEVYK